MSSPDKYLEELGSPQRRSVGLNERLIHHLKPISNPNEAAKSSPIAFKLLERWKRQFPFDDVSMFGELLDFYNTDEDSLIRALDLPYRKTPHVDEPIESEATSALDLINDKSKEYSPATDAHLRGFLAIASPLIIDREEELLSRLKKIEMETHGKLFTTEEIFPQLQVSLEHAILKAITRTCVLELNAERVRENLEGETSERRFESFLEKLGSNEYLEKLYYEYPILPSVLDGVSRRWVETNYEVFFRFARDYDHLKKKLQWESEPGRVVSIKFDQGDRHQNGRAVMILQFSSGYKLVYKPRPMGVHVAFQKFLEWCNAKSVAGLQPFLITRVIDRGAYGWMEFIPAVDCDSLEAVSKFYWRQGAYLALFYLFHTVDLHHENLIAHGEHPVFVDLESVLHPVEYSWKLECADMPAKHCSPFTVAQIGLLPDYVWAEEGRKGIDISGLGAAEGEEYPFKASIPVDFGTDALRMRLQVTHMPASQHRPRVDGEPVSHDKYCESITSGFTAIYRLLKEHKTELLSPDGPLKSFKAVRLRRILRPTAIYGCLLTDSNHPNFLRDYSERERNWSLLFAGAKRWRWLLRVIQYEIRDLDRGDVPYFATTFESHDAIASDGEVISSLFAQTSEQLLQGQIHQLSEEDLEAQLRLMHSSLQMNEKRSGRVAARKHDSQLGTKANRRTLLINEAEELADRLADLAIYREGRPYWTSYTHFESSDPGTFVPGAETNLYGGELGIALFLGVLGSVAQRDDLKSLGLKTLQWIQAGIESGNSRLTSSSAYLGTAGFIYTATLLGRFLDNKDLLQAGKLALPDIRKGLEIEGSHSIINGASSAVLALDSIKEDLPEKDVCAIVSQCCEKIMETALEQEHGVAWDEDADADIPLTGFAHGVAGYATALAVGGHLVGESKWIDFALHAIEYERANFLKGKLNWADHRKIAHELGGNIFAWCTGAPGIGLSRIRMWPFVSRNERDAYLTSEIGMAIKGTLSYGLGDNHSLCHGDLGNLDFLLQASARMSNGKLRETVNDYTDWLLQDAQTNGWRCGAIAQKSNAGSAEIPGLMLGLSGIGMGLLRLAMPDSIPSVLGPNGTV